MSYQFMADTHTHSDSSPDGIDPPTSLCERAVKRGLVAIAITDHCEMNSFYQDHYDRSLRQAVFETVKAREVFRGRVKVLVGVEMGQATQNYACAERVAQTPMMDFVLASLHNIRGKQDFYYLDYKKENIKRLLESYFSEMLELVQWGHFDSLAHLTYPLRYIQGVHGIPVDLSPYRDLIDDILQTLASQEKGLEINASTLDSPLASTMPDLKIIRRFKELGGEIITVGSDAHQSARVGFGIERGMDLAKQAGFTRVAYFEQHKPVFLSLN